MALPYVTNATYSKSGAVASAGRAQAAVALLWTCAIAAALVRMRLTSFRATIAALGAAAAVTLIAGLRFRARAGGVTGDFLGAAQQVAECAIVVALVIARDGAVR